MYQSVQTSAKKTTANQTGASGLARQLELEVALGYTDPSVAEEEVFSEARPLVVDLDSDSDSDSELESGARGDDDLVVQDEDEESESEDEEAAGSQMNVEHEGDDGVDDSGEPSGVGTGADVQETVVFRNSSTVITCFGSGLAADFAPILAKAFPSVSPATTSFAVAGG